MSVASDAGDTATLALTKANINPNRNLLNIDDALAVFGQYVDYTDGNAKTNIAFNASGFIPITGGRTFSRSFTPPQSSDLTGIYGGQIAYYDANKAFIGGDQAGSKTTFTAPAGAFYMRVSVPLANWATGQIEEGATSTAWVPYANNIPPSQGPHFQTYTLRQTHYRLMKLALPTPEAVQLVINLPGDSYTHNAARWSGAFMQYLAAKYGDAGGGWCGFGFLANGETKPYTAGNQPGFMNGNVRPATYGTRVLGSGTATYYTEASCDLASYTLSASGDAVEQDFPASPTISAIMLHYKAGTGSIRYGYAAQGSTPASLTTISLTGTAGTTQVVALSLTNLVQPGTLRIEWVSGTAVLFGVNLKSAANGVRVNKIAATGSTSAAWAAVDQDNFQSSFADLGGQLTMMMSGTNEQGAATQPAAFVANMRILINRFRGLTSAVQPTNAMDILIATPPENQRTNNTVAMAAYALNLRRLAFTKRTAYLDAQLSFGSAATPSEYGATGVVPLYNADTIHPEALTGGRLMLSDILRAVLPY